MMIKVFISFLIILISSVQTRPQKLFKYTLKEFHSEIVGEDSVNNFHRVFPFIVSNDYVYLAYLQNNYYNVQLQKIISNDYKRRSIRGN